MLNAPFGQIHDRHKYDRYIYSNIPIHQSLIVYTSGIYTLILNRYILCSHSPVGTSILYSRWKKYVHIVTMEKYIYYQALIVYYRLCHLLYTYLSHIKSLRLRKSMPQMLPALMIIRSGSGAPITILLEGSLFLIRGGDRPRGEWEW